MALLKEKLNHEYNDVKDIYTKALEKAENLNNSILQVFKYKNLTENFFSCFSA